MGVLLELQRDAARYRWLRDKADSMACTAAPMVARLDKGGRMVTLLDGDDLDAAVDLATAQPKARRPLTTKRRQTGAAMPLAMGFLSLGMLLFSAWAFGPHASEPQVHTAPALVPAPGSGFGYVPYVFLDNDTGCQYLSTHNSTGLAPRIAAVGKTHMGCKGVVQ